MERETAVTQFPVGDSAQLGIYATSVVGISKVPYGDNCDSRRLDFETRA